MFKVFLVLYAPLVNSRQRNPTLHGSLFKALRIREFQDFELVRYFVAPTWFFKRLHICWIDLLFGWMVWLSFDDLFVFVYFSLSWPVLFFSDLLLLFVASSFDHGTT